MESSVYGALFEYGHETVLKGVVFGVMETGIIASDDDSKSILTAVFACYSSVRLRN